MVAFMGANYVRVAAYVLFCLVMVSVTLCYALHLLEEKIKWNNFHPLLDK